MRPDILTTNLGTIISVQGVSLNGQRWMTRHVPDVVYFAADCDHRSGLDILDGMLKTGPSRDGSVRHCHDLRGAG